MPAKASIHVFLLTEEGMDTRARPSAAPGMTEIESADSHPCVMLAKAGIHVFLLSEEVMDARARPTAAPGTTEIESADSYPCVMPAKAGIHVFLLSEEGMDTRARPSAAPDMTEIRERRFPPLRHARESGHPRLSAFGIGRSHGRSGSAYGRPKHDESSRRKNLACVYAVMPALAWASTCVPDARAIRWCLPQTRTWRDKTRSPIRHVRATARASTTYGRSEKVKSWVAAIRS